MCVLYDKVNLYVQKPNFKLVCYVQNCIVSNKHLSSPDLRDPFYVSILVWSGRELGWEFYVLCFYDFLFLCFGRVWFSIRDSCLSLSLIGKPFSLLVLWEVVFVSGTISPCKRHGRFCFFCW